MSCVRFFQCRFCADGIKFFRKVELKSHIAETHLNKAPNLSTVEANKAAAEDPYLLRLSEIFLCATTAKEETGCKLLTDSAAQHLLAPEHLADYGSSVDSGHELAKPSTPAPQHHTYNLRGKKYQSPFPKKSANRSQAKVQKNNVSSVQLKTLVVRIPRMKLLDRSQLLLLPNHEMGIGNRVPKRRRVTTEELLKGLGTVHCSESRAIQAAKTVSKRFCSVKTEKFVSKDVEFAVKRVSQGLKKRQTTLRCRSCDQIIVFTGRSHCLVRRGIMSHVYEHLSKLPLYQCRLCQFQFAHEKVIKKHIDSCHGGIKLKRFDSLVIDDRMKFEKEILNHLDMCFSKK